jgi:hypothetical protein
MVRLDCVGNREHDKKVKVRRRHKEGRYLIAHAHERTMKSGFPPLIDSPWASADGFRRSLSRSHPGLVSSCFGLTVLSCTLGNELSVSDSEMEKAELRQVL